MSPSAAKGHWVTFFDLREGISSSSHAEIPWTQVEFGFVLRRIAAAFATQSSEHSEVAHELACLALRAWHGQVLQRPDFLGLERAVARLAKAQPSLCEHPSICDARAAR